MTDPHARWIDPNPPSPVDTRAPVILTISGVAFTLVVVVALVTVVMLFGGKAHDDPTAPKVALLAANAPVADPFTGSILVTPVTMSDQAVTKAAALLRQLPISADRGAHLVSGRQPTLYGTTGETLPCDVVTLANHLDADNAVAQIWGLALGLTTQQIPYYLNTLTAVILMDDTWVSTHTLTAGSDNPQQAVLQAGTAVLVDSLGVPRVHCVSGAPLTPPANDDLTKYRADGAWPDFSPQTVAAVAYGSTDAARPGGEFVLLDIATGEQVTRKTGGTIALGTATVPLPDPAVMNVPLGAR